MQQFDIKKLWHLFVIFFKAGTFTFAGGLAMLPVIEKEIVEKYKFMSRDDFMEYATLSQTLPGVIALNCASFVGRRAAGIPGMFVAGFGATFSAFVLMLGATIAMQYIPQSGSVMGAMRCIRSASAAMILSAAVSLGAHNLKSTFAVVLMLAAFSAVLFFNISTPLVVLVSGVVGYIGTRLSNKKRGAAQ